MKINAKYLSVLFAGAALLSTGMIAQQEVSPDHFEDTPAVSKKAVAAKPTPKKRAASHVASKPKSQPVQVKVVQPAVAPVQTASNR